MSTAIGGDHGHWSNLLRKCFDHDRLAYNRRTNHEYRDNVTSRSSAYFSAARLHRIKPLIPLAETDCSLASCSTICLPLKNGKTSSTKRIQTMTPVSWNRGAQSERSAGRHHRFGQQHQHEAHPRAKRDIQLPLCRVFGRASAIHGNQMKSAVTRIAINIFRIISIIALLRSLESLLPGGEGAVSHRKTSCVPCWTVPD